MSTWKLTAFPAIIVLFIIAALSTIVLPSSISKWTILSTSAIPTLTNAGISPAFIQVVFRFGETVTLGLTPIFAYYVIYLALIEKYNQDEKPISLFTTLKYQLPYAFATAAILLVILIVWQLVGLPVGIKAFPTI